ncbi:MAG: hypothetical protein ACTHM6_00905 [Tepidisphaeraceae bacterium]
MNHGNSFIDTLEPRQLLAATLTPGITYSTAIKTAGAQKNWSITVSAGQAIVVSAGEATANSSFNPELILIAPNGKTLARGIGSSGAFVSRSAPVSGTYRVRVIDRDRTATSSIQVTAFFSNGAPITDGDDAGVANSGRRFGATISPGDLDVWRINAKAGQFITGIADENTPGDPIGIGMLIVGPDGKGIVSQASPVGVTLNIPQKKITDGIYYAVVYDSTLTGTGRYGISFIQTPGPQTTEDPDTQTPLQSGVTRNGQIPAGDVDVFQKDFTAGQHLTITATRDTGNTTPDILLIDPTGKQVAAASGATSATVNFDVTLAGTYSIALLNATSGTGGSYNLTYVVT